MSDTKRLVPMTPYAMLDNKRNRLKLAGLSGVLVHVFRATEYVVMLKNVCHVRQRNNKIQPYTPCQQFYLKTSFQVVSQGENNIPSHPHLHTYNT